jgi:hypothetical protein
MARFRGEVGSSLEIVLHLSLGKVKWLNYRSKRKSDKYLSVA